MYQFFLEPNLPAAIAAPAKIKSAREEGSGTEATVKSVSVKWPA